MQNIRGSAPHESGSHNILHVRCLFHECVGHPKETWVAGISSSWRKITKRERVVGEGVRGS